MNRKRFVGVLCGLFANVALVGASSAETYPLRVDDLRIRDPFVVVADGTYLMYESKPWYGGKSVNVFESKDLIHWSERKSVMTIPETLDNTAVWAPEVHRYRGKWYLFVTLTMKPGAWEIKPMQEDGYKLGTLQPRGTWIYVADSPRGPFVPVRNGSVTPKEWMCLDGTFFEEDGKPYMIFCHEWCQTGNGRMMLAELKPDLSGFVGEPKELFRASSAGGRFHVTDGPFLYRSPVSGKLFMTWSNMGDKGYSVYLKTSESGSVRGPWRNAGKLFSKDGGHGMFFKDLAGRLQFVLHQPNKGPLERMKAFPVRETADTIAIDSAVAP